MSQVSTGTAPTYKVRTDAFSKPVTYRLESSNGSDSDVLVLEPEGGAAERIPLSQITDVHLMAAPSRAASGRYLCTLRTGGRKIVLSNTHYKSLANFEDQSAEFRSFVEALHQGIGRAAPAATGRIGSSPVGYALALFFGWGFLIALAALVVVFWDALQGRTLIKAIVALFLVGAMWRYTVSNKPRTYSPAALPAGILPGSASPKR